ncbi:MAG: SRPBCC family protein [Acidimicrobiales bacterium]
MSKGSKEVVVEAMVDATPEAVYEVVSDVTSMGRWSPENTGARWTGTARGPEVGARFRGSNRRGWRRWSTTCTVVSADRGREFSFDVRLGPMPIARWTYRFAAEAGGCRVVETCVDRRPRFEAAMDPVFMGIKDRTEHNRENMQATLANLARFFADPAKPVSE